MTREAINDALDTMAELTASLYSFIHLNRQTPQETEAIAKAAKALRNQSFNVDAALIELRKA